MCNSKQKPTVRSKLSNCTKNRTPRTYLATMAYVLVQFNNSNRFQIYVVTRFYSSHLFSCALTRAMQVSKLCAIQMDVIPFCDVYFCKWRLTCEQAKIYLLQRFRHIWYICTCVSVYSNFNIIYTQLCIKLCYSIAM